MQEEYLDLVDEHDQVIGRKLRKQVYAENLHNFRVVNVLLVNSKGEIWIPRRTADKHVFPLCLDMSMGGHVSSGETYEDALVRELEEELRIDAKITPLKFLGVLNHKANGVSANMKVYELHTDEVPKYNQDDFVEFFWLTPRALFERIAAGEKTKGDLPKIIRAFYGEEYI